MSQSKLCQPVELDTAATLIHIGHTLTFKVQPRPRGRLERAKAYLVLKKRNGTRSQGGEGQFLWALFQEEFYFNLHGQGNIYTIGPRR